MVAAAGDAVSLLILLVRPVSPSLVLEVGVPGPPGPAGEAGISGVATVQVEQVAHGLSVKDWIAFDGTSWIPAQATIGGIRCDGVVTQVTDADTFGFVPAGMADFNLSHGYPLGPLYLSQDTAGTATSTAPAGGMSQRVGTAISTTRVIVQQLPQEER